MSWEIKGTVGSLEALPHITYQSKVSAPKNPKLIREIKAHRKLKPSEFLREMSMDTRQKLASTHEMYLPRIIELLDMGETSLQKNTQLMVDEPMFQPYPSEIFFQKFEPFVTYEIPLLLRNNDKVPRLVKVTQLDTPYFKIITSADAHQKVGPGLPIIYKIQFIPEENKDYNHELIVTTEREKFIVPIKCIGSRAILDFPDEINFSTDGVCPVKHSNFKVLCIRNIGNKDAKFSLKCEEPFSVQPDHGILPIGENMQVTVFFNPQKCGEYKKELAISYDSSETIFVSLYGSAQDINVRLDKSSIRIEDTYITMSNQRTVTLNNRSDIIVHFEWKKFATHELEQQQKIKEVMNLHKEEENAKIKMSNLTDDYIALLSRNFQNKIKTTEVKSFHFDDEVFFIQPIEGDIWPNSSFDVSIIFKPDYAQTYNKIAYCEVSGRESRLPLRLTGVGAGPKVQLSIEKLDVGSVFIGSTHVYEVVLSNKGFIDAIYNVNIPNSQFGKYFQFEPNEGLISPGGYQAISITFTCNKLGDFNETFDFTIDGKPEKYNMHIMGTVIPPTFNFDVPKIKYGLVSYGFKYTHQCLLTNTSLVPMSFNLRVASDSEVKEIIDSDQEQDEYNFKEFSLIPSQGIIPPQSEIKLMVEFVPHFIKKYETFLIVDIENVGNDLYNLPISARSTVSQISILTPNIDLGRCFIYHSYEKIIQLSNETSLKARYYLLPSKSQDPIKFVSNQAEGVIEPNSVKYVSVFAESLQLGDIQADLLIKINGSVEPPIKCNFICISQGPVCQILPKEIDWGLTTVLQNSPRDITISNESLIEAKFKAYMGKRNSAWRIEPSQGVVEPGTEIVLKAVCYLIDKTRYEDSIFIELQNANTHRINVRAQGAGSSIVSEPNIGNLIDFGTFFSGGLLKRVYKLTNKSSRQQSLSFLPDTPGSSLNRKDTKSKIQPNTLFKITPNRVELNPGEMKEVIVEGFGEKPQLIEEYFICNSIIGKTSGKDRIMRFKIRCEFVAPLVSFSTRELIFRCEHDGKSLPPSQVKYLTISNVSSLDLTAQLSTISPFSLVEEDTGNLLKELFVRLKTGDSLHIGINYNTTFKQDLHNEISNGLLTISYTEHQHNDVVNLRGEIYFPNIHLETNFIDFGCILNNTEVTKIVKMTNIGPLTVNYKWKFILEKDNVVSMGSQTNRSEQVEENKNLHIDLSSITNENNEQSEEQSNLANSQSLIDQSKAKIEQKLEEILMKHNDFEMPTIEEIFNVTPLFGSLNPGESQNLTVTYFGHKELRAYVKAECEIESGPNYQLMLKGEASVLNYELSNRNIDLGNIPFDEISECTLSIKNLGRVTIEYSMIGYDTENTSEFVIEPDFPIIVPFKGTIDADKTETITIRYLPGTPKKFSKTFQLQISHFAPEDITIQGDAGFADIMLDLPRFETDGYKQLRREAKSAAKNAEHKSDADISALHLAPELDLQVEIDRLAIENFVKNYTADLAQVVTVDKELESEKSFDKPEESEEKLNSPNEPSPKVSARQLVNLQSKSAVSNKTVLSSKSQTKKKVKPFLPDYILDFGHVILGTVKTHVVRAANMGKLFASFEIERQNFSKTGFLIDLEKVKNLPTEESVEFVVTFDPRGANLGLGPVEHVIPINIINGPYLNLRLKANVTMPDLQISNDIVDFSDVKCGECKIITVQLNNHKEVRCDWSASYLPKKDEKFTPMHLKRKKKLDAEQNRPKIFEIMPPSGILMPGQKINIQLKFMPTEEKMYEERVTIRMAQSSQRLMILCKGKGLEPRIEMSKNSLEFEPILPHSSGDEQEVKIVNPCTYPIEIYNLEFDKSYLEDERILRIIRGYDEYNTILLPPRNVGDKLPNELYEYYEEQQKKLEEEDQKQKQLLNDTINEIENQETNPNSSQTLEKSEIKIDSSSTQQVGDVEKNPVFDSIARYLGIDLSSEGRAARNRRGVSMVVHGPPLSGKSRASVALAKHYECALLTIDSIIIDAIASSTSPAAAKARQFCAEAAAKYAEEEKAEMARNLVMTGAQSSAAPAGGLSVEALAQHSIIQGGTQGGSKKTSVAGDSHGNIKLPKRPKGDASNADQSSNHPSTPPPLSGPIARKLSISTNLFSQEDGYMSTVLPEDVIVDILSDRFLLSDCNRGIIIDGLDTLFAQNNLLAASAVLKAFNNRRYIYFVIMKSDFQKYKEQLNKLQEEKLKQKKEQELLEQLFIEEMDEETYNSLPSERRKEIDDRFLATKKLRLKKEAEEKAAERERIERELAEQQARLEEEKQKKKKKTATGGKDSEKKSMAQSQAVKKETTKDFKEKPEPIKEKQTIHVPNGTERPHTRVDAPIEEPEKIKKNVKSHEEDSIIKEKLIDPEEEKRKESEKLLQQRFKTFDLHFKELCNLLEAWDRTQGTVFRQPSPSEKSDPDDHLPRKPTKPNKNKEKEKDKKEKDKEKEKAEAEKLKAEQLQQQQQQQQHQQQQQQQQTVDENDENQDQSMIQNQEGKEDGIGVPCIIIENVNKSELDEIYKHQKFPPISEVLDGMGLGPKGPPIPPPATFAVVPYPVYRKAPAGADFSHYIFVTTNENDPNLIPEEKPKQDISIIPESGLEGEKTPDNPSAKSGPKSQKSQKTTASRNESRGGAEMQRRASGERKRTESRVNKRDAGAQSPNRGSSSLSGNKGEDNLDGTASIDGSSLEKPSQKLQRFRWILPPHGEITIRLRFTSEETGQFDQTLSFELVGTRRRYQLHCRGICTFPTISREPRIVFLNRKKNKEPNEIVSKKYLMTEDVFEFGPLLVGNNKDRCREGKFPEYVENLNIQNVSPLDADVSFCFLDDTNDKVDSCFFLEPSELSLKPNETKQLKIFACPREPKIYTDTLICCVKENPEPVTFKISCHGQKPELALDKKEFNFKQVLLHRKDSKDIKMTNNTLIPVQWRLEGVDLLGEEFVCNQISGIIEPYQSFNLILHFRALRPLQITPKDKKILKLLVSSVNSFLGFMENHAIVVTAEAYDVALEINLPKGNDGGLEFGNVRVNNESKLNCTLKNKGKYPIKFNFLTEAMGPNTVELLKYLTISPAFGELPSAHDRNSQNQIVTVTVNPRKEIFVKDAPVLKCQITEPTVNDGSIIANIPIKLSVKALVSKFGITPQSEINFGPILNNTRRQERFVIENKGEFDFKFTISKYTGELAKIQTKDGVQNQARLQCGVYTITPAYGILLPQGGHQIITVDCAPDAPGRYEEDLVIDIVDRDMNEYPNGIMYKLVSESVQPSISNSNEIFEEHTIVPNLSSLNSKMMGVGIYVEDENKFFFNNVIVGRTAKARFKLINNNKIPIDLNIALNSKPSNTKANRQQALTESPFEIEPSKVQIAPFCHVYAVVSFTPTSMTSYNSFFEAALETLSSNNSTTKNKTINFEIYGDGNLPRFTVIKPNLRNKKGQTLMLFKRSILNHTDSQQLVLSNDGNLPTKVNFYLIDPDSAFRLKPLETNKNGVVMNDKTVSSVVIQPNTQVAFSVSCTPKNVQTYQGSLQLTVTDNQFEDTLIQFIGEGYVEDVTIENLHSLPNSNEEDEVLSDEEACALKSNMINFGDVYANEKKQLLFTMKNLSKTDCYRFEWPSGTGSNSPTEQSSASIIQFSPKIGHLHAGCAKDITVSFKSMEPKHFKKEAFLCNLSKIIFDQPINEVKDWDDRLTIVKYVNEFVQNSVSTGPTNVSTSLNEPSTLFTQRQMSEANISSVVNQFNSQLQQHQQQPTASNLSQMSNKQIIRKKVVDTEPEPKYTKSDESVQPLELFVSANCDYSRYRCKTSSIRFKETLMFQTRVYEVTVINRGKISFDYNWKVSMEDSRRPFTPQIQPDTPTPEHSQSPPGRTSKTSKSGNENSVSPSRKNTKENAKDTKKDSNKNPNNPKKLSSKESLDEKQTKNSTRKSKENKNSTGDINDDGQTQRTLDDNFINTAIQPLRSDSPNNNRAESSLSQNAPSSIAETGYIPFSVEPSFGKIEPGKSQIFKVKFSPLNVNDYQARIICQIPNTEDGKIGHIIPIKGRGSLPYCHFELEESDYLTSGRRNPELPGPSGAASGLGLDQMTRVIEFNCVGVGNKVVKKFEIINPTNMDYDFEWSKEEQNDGKRHNQFVCYKTQGNLLSGRKTEITFEFDPTEVGIEENFWKFTIPKFDLSIPFLLVGISTEPKVIFDKSYIMFKPLLVGRSGTETVYILNQENKKLKFDFDQTSCYTDSRSEVVLVNPCSGEIEPNSKFPICLTFTPHEQRKSVFNLKCLIESSKKPIGLNVKGEGFSIQTSLYCEDTNTGNKIEFSDTCINEIHMGEVEKNEVCFRNLFISNQGKHLANFEWYLNSQFPESLECFTIEPNVGYIEPGDRKHCVLKYQAKHERSTIANLILKIDNGSVYHVHLDGIAVRPDLQFSLQEIDFGPCFVYKAGMKLNTTSLTMTNRGHRDLNVSCLTELSSAFQFDFKQQILQPGKSLTSVINFIPREVKTYSETLVFELNGLTRREVKILGAGAQMKVELFDMKNKLFDIGTLQLGKISKKPLQIINRSVSSINFNLIFEPKSEILVKDKSIIQITPLQNITLKPNQIFDLQVKFSPRGRIPKFIEDILIEYNGIHAPLCSLQGACHGYNIWLETNTLPFGAITQKCSTTKRIMMHNDGDIGASFKWDVEKMKPEFSIYPHMGYISAGMEITFDITLNPTELASDLRKENIKCFIEGNTPLSLTLTGSCVQIIPQKETHHFETNVRQKETKQITISNRTNAQWDLKPIIEGEFFSGLETFIVEANNTNSYEITYFPISMTTNDKKHTGSVFFPLPDGTGLFYNLTGTANSPKPIGKIQREVPCKTQYVEVLQVENWLKKAQRFKVNFEITKPDKPDPSTTIKGNDYIDVPGNGKKEYRINYLAHKEGVTILKVQFKNEQTNEYAYYEMGFKAVKATSIGTIDLVTQVRVPISYSLKLENPLQNMVTFTATCTNSSEILIPNNVTISSKSQGDFNFEFLPLKSGESMAKLEITSSELGTSIYDLNLKAIPAATEKPIYFKTALGSSQVQVSKFVNFCKQKTDYVCKVSSPDFKVDKSIPAAPSTVPSGIEVSFDITYEPSNLVDTKATLTLTSPIAGEYVIPLFGTCLQPKPQGPFVIKSGSNRPIEFKNVFLSPLNFSFAIDNPLFHVAKQNELIKPHQIHKIVVGFDGNDSSSKADVMAKLVITAPKSAGVTNNIQWVYYLKGVSNN